MKHIKYLIAAATLIVSAACMPAVAWAGALTDYAKNHIIDAMLRGQSISAPATQYLALYTTCPTVSTAGVEVSGPGYARASVTAALASWAGTQGIGTTTASSGSSGATSNNSAASFGPSSGSWGTINCIGIVDAASGGNIWIFSPVTTPWTISNSGATLTLNPGTATFTFN